MDICEKVAYIKGLAEGLELDNDSKEGKILAAIIDVLGDITEEICDIEDGCDALMEQIDAVDEDLSYVEEIIYGDDDECDCDCCDGDCEDDDQLYEVECPACNDVIYLDDIIIGTGVDKYDIEEALLYWEDAGLLVKKDSAAPVKKEPLPETVSRSQKPSRADVAKRGLEDAKIRHLLSEAQLKFGRGLKSNEAQ